MKTKMTVNGVSVCPTGEERHEYFTLTLSPRRKKRLCQYDYRHTDGELFSCVAPTLEECRAKRDTWLNNRTINRRTVKKEPVKLPDIDSNLCGANPHIGQLFRRRGSMGCRLAQKSGSTLRKAHASRRRTTAQRSLPRNTTQSMCRSGCNAIPPSPTLFRHKFNPPK